MDSHPMGKFHTSAVSHPGATLQRPPRDNHGWKPRCSGLRWTVCPAGWGGWFCAWHCWWPNWNGASSSVDLRSGKTWTCWNESRGEPQRWVEGWCPCHDKGVRTRWPLSPLQPQALDDSMGWGDKLSPAGHQMPPQSYYVTPQLDKAEKIQWKIHGLR